MRYEVRLRKAPEDYKPEFPGLTNSGLVVDVYCITWWGLRKEKIVDGILADEVNYDNAIRQDYRNRKNININVSFFSSQGTYEHNPRKYYV